MLKNIIKKAALSVLGLAALSGTMTVPASAQVISVTKKDFYVSSYNLYITELFRLKKCDKSLVDKNHNGKLDKGEISLGGAHYNFSALMAADNSRFGPAYAFITQSYGVPGGKGMSSRRWESMVKDGSPTLFYSSPDAQYNYSPTCYANRSQTLYCGTNGKTSVINLVYGKYTVQKSGLPKYVLPESRTFSVTPVGNGSPTTTKSQYPNSDQTVTYKKYPSRAVYLKNNLTYLTIQTFGKHTGNPVAGAKMKLMNGKKTVASWISKKSGKYTIEGLTPGKTYTIYASSNGKKNHMSFKMPASSNAKVSFKIEGDRKNLNFSMPKLKKTYKKNQKINISPLSHASGLKFQVAVYDSKGQHAYFSNWSAKGKYVFSAKKAGKYRLKISSWNGEKNHTKTKSAYFSVK